MDPGDSTRGEQSSSPDVRTGYVAGNTFAAKEVRYSVVGDKAIFEGDIVLGTVEEVERFTEETKRRAAGDDGGVEAVIISGNQYRWPEALIPYDIDGTLPNQSRFTDAIQHWEQRTAVRFVNRTGANQASYPDYVHFQDDGSGCQSAVGKRGGQQNVDLAADCSSGNCIHEIGHAVGLWHEQSREDRDTYVEVEWAHIMSGYEHNFDQQIADGDDVGAYDYGSIMHYPLDAFSKDGQPTIRALKTIPAGVTIGQRTALSDGDLAAVQAMYPVVFWGSLGGWWPGDPGLGRNADGRLEVFLRGNDTNLYHAWQTSPNDGWSQGWASMGGSWHRDPVVGRNADGRLEVFVVGDDTNLYHVWQASPSSGWSQGWAPMGGSWPGTPAVAQNADGRLEVFLRGNDTNLYHEWQTSPNSGWSPGWAPMGGSWHHDPVVGRNADGRLEVFVVGNDGHLYHCWQTAPNDGWSEWSSLGGTWPGDAGLGQNADGRLEVFLRGTDANLYHKWQTAPNQDWNEDWTPMGGSWHHDPVVGRNADGRLEVFVVGDTTRLYHAWQTRPNDGWSQGWAPVGGWWTGWPGRPAVTQNADGRIELFLRGYDTQLYHTWQVAANDGWALI